MDCEAAATGSKCAWRVEEEEEEEEGTWSAELAAAANAVRRLGALAAKAAADAELEMAAEETEPADELGGAYAAYEGAAPRAETGGGG